MSGKLLSGFFNVSIGFRFLIINVTEFNLELNWSKCNHQDSVLSTIRPRKLVLVEFSIYMSSYFTLVWVVSMCLAENWISFVLLKFNVNELACNHFIIFWSIISISLLNILKSWCVQIKFVSSANRNGDDMSLIVSSKSLM
jgi:hypothetical protein